MKLLYYSSDDQEVAQVEKEFAQAGIECEVRHDLAAKILHQPPCSELWIRHDRDCHRALMLCVQLGLGFARRSRKSSVVDSWSEIYTGSAAAADEQETESRAEEIPMETHPMDRLKRKAA